MATDSSPRSKRLLESLGYYVWKTETWNQWSRRRTDIWNIGDHAAIKKDGSGSGTMYVQSCGEDVQTHLRKVMEGYEIKDGKHKGEKIPPNPYILPLLKQGNPIFLWAWRLRQDVGKRKTWQLKEYEFVLKDGIVIVQETEAKP